MSLHVEVALIGDHTVPFEQEHLDEQFYDMPYAERVRVGFEVEEGESLGATLERAADAMGIVPRNTPWAPPRVDASYHRVAFFKPEDEAGFAPRAQGRMHLTELTLVDDRGRALFGVSRLHAVRFSDLIRAADAGVIDGDPLRPYLILDQGWGDWPGVDWATTQTALDVVWEVVKAVAALTGAAAGVVKARSWLRERVDRGRTALATNPVWAQRGDRPDQLAALVSLRPWKTHELAALLGCSESEAEGILWILGFSYDPETERWQRGHDEPAEMLSHLLSAIEWAVHEGGDWQTRLRRWLITYIENDALPPYEMLSLPPLADLDDDDAPYDEETFASPRESLRDLAARVQERIRAVFPARGRPRR